MKGILAERCASPSPQRGDRLHLRLRGESLTALPERGEAVEALLFPVLSLLGHTSQITAKLFAATPARATDWMVRLVDVRPDGYAAFLCGGVMRARHRTR